MDLPFLWTESSTESSEALDPAQKIIATRGQARHSLCQPTGQDWRRGPSGKEDGGSAHPGQQPELSNIRSLTLGFTANRRNCLSQGKHIQSANAPGGPFPWERLAPSHRHSGHCISTSRGRGTAHTMDLNSSLWPS